MTSTNAFPPARRSVETLSGRIAFVEAGSGPPVLFLHPALTGSQFWRGQLARLSADRRCIAIDLLAHGDTEIVLAQPVSAIANVRMLGEFLDALQIHALDLVGCGAGGEIALAFAARYPSRVRSLAIVHTGQSRLAGLAAEGLLRNALEQMLTDTRIFRADTAFGPLYGRPEVITDAVIKAYLRPLIRTEQRTRDVERFLAGFEVGEDACLLARLSRLKTPTLIAWGDADPSIEPRRAQERADTIPGVRRRLAIAGGRGHLAEEQPDAFAAALSEHWRAACAWIDGEVAA